MDQGLHVYASTPGKVYETTDGAESWTLLNTTVPLGTCYTFKVRARAVSVLLNPTLHTQLLSILFSTFLTLLYCLPLLAPRTAQSAARSTPWRAAVSVRGTNGASGEDEGGGVEGGDTLKGTSKCCMTSNLNLFYAIHSYIHSSVSTLPGPQIAASPTTPSQVATGTASAPVAGGAPAT